jgi:acyl dehydratase
MAMPINPNAVGTTSDPVERSWTSKDALLYAVGVGAGLDELQYTTENSRGIDQQVLPTFAVIAGIGGNAMAEIGDFNFAMLVHGEQAIQVHKPIPVEGTVRTVSKITAIWDKGSGAVIETEAECVDAKTGEPQFTNRSAVFIRGEGGWGGDRGPSGGRNAAPERAPDHAVTYETRADQALTYRLSGDRNPLHSDPAFAAMAGFEKPILHGLCTYGFTGRALLHTLCGGEAARFKSMEGRFSRPVYPGDTLTVSMWVLPEADNATGGAQAVFQTTTQRDEIVIDGGRCVFA